MGLKRLRDFIAECKTGWEQGKTAASAAVAGQRALENGSGMDRDSLKLEFTKILELADKVQTMARNLPRMAANLNDLPAFRYAWHDAAQSTKLEQATLLPGDLCRHFADALKYNVESHIPGLRADSTEAEIRTATTSHMIKSMEPLASSDMKGKLAGLNGFMAAIESTLLTPLMVELNAVASGLEHMPAESQAIVFEKIRPYLEAVGIVPQGYKIPAPR